MLIDEHTSSLGRSQGSSAPRLREVLTLVKLLKKATNPAQSADAALVPPRRARYCEIQAKTGRYCEIGPNRETTPF